MPDHEDTTSLDFERADFSSQSGGPGRPACEHCAEPLAGSYYTHGDQMLCERCHFAARDAGPPGSKASRAFGALGLGCVAAVAGGLLWLIVTEVTGYELGLIAIVVGLLVGSAVHIGARGVGGVGYQLLAVALTYTSIVMTYVPSIVEDFRSSDDFMAGLVAEEGADPIAVTFAEGEGGEGVLVDAPPAEPLDEAGLTIVLYMIAIPIAFTVPFLMGFENAIGILIIGFALWEAGRRNQRVVVEMKGPFRLGAGDPALG